MWHRSILGYVVDAARASLHQTKGKELDTERADAGRPTAWQLDSLNRQIFCQPFVTKHWWLLRSLQQGSLWTLLNTKSLKAATGNGQKPTLFLPQTLCPDYISWQGNVPRQSHCELKILPKLTCSTSPCCVWLCVKCHYNDLHSTLMLSGNRGWLPAYVEVVWNNEEWATCTLYVATFLYISHMQMITDRAGGFYHWKFFYFTLESKPPRFSDLLHIYTEYFLQ